MASFRDLLKNTSAYLTQKAKDAANWYRSQVEKIQKSRGTYQVDPDGLNKTTGAPVIGKMYLYTYNPKLREKLPFFDMYPLTIPIDYFKTSYGAGFIGLNLHYLPPLARLALLSQLMDLSTNKTINDQTRLNISYRILKNAQQKYGGYKQCIKKYYINHVVSSFYEIPPKDWEHVVMLQLQHWVNNPNKTGNPPY